MIDKAAPTCPKCIEKTKKVVYGVLSGDFCWVCPKCKKEISFSGAIIEPGENCKGFSCREEEDSWINLFKDEEEII